MDLYPIQGRGGEEVVIPLNMLKKKKKQDKLTSWVGHFA